MPHWKTHIEIAKRCNEFLKFNKSDYTLFLFGNILPDINNGYIISDIVTHIDRNYTHFKDNDSHKIYLNFYNEYKNNIKNPMILGYYCHLYADYSFNNFAYPILNNNESFKNYTKDELRRFKQDEFKRYNTNFSDNNITIYDCNEILEETKKINRVKIYKDDIIKVNKYLNNGENIQNLNFFNKNDFDILIGDIVNEIKNFYFNNK